MNKEEIIVVVSKDLKEIFPNFLKNRKQDLDQIKTFIQDNNFAGIQTISHKLAGNAGSYGLKDLGIIGASMEDACKKKDIIEIEKLFNHYQDYISKLKVVFE